MKISTARICLGFSLFAVAGLFIYQINDVRKKYYDKKQKFLQTNEIISPLENKAIQADYYSKDDFQRAFNYATQLNSTQSIYPKRP